MFEKKYRYRVVSERHVHYSVSKQTIILDTSRRDIFYKNVTVVTLNKIQHQLRVRTYFARTLTSLKICDLNLKFPPQLIETEI